MDPSIPAAARARALGVLTIVVLAFVASLWLFTGGGACTSAVAFDRPAEEVREHAPVALAGDEGDARVDVASHVARGAPIPVLGAVEGVVVDALTGEPVPEVDVELRAGSHAVVVATGADGRFAAGDFAAGRIVARVRDAGADVGEATVEHVPALGTRDWRIEVPIGPTIPIRSIDGNVFDPAAWKARVRESALSPEVVAEIALAPRGGYELVVPSAARVDRAWSWKDVRPGSPPWLRYPSREHAPTRTARVALEVLDGVANRKGAAAIEDTVGIQSAVEPDTRAFARVRLKIRRDREVSMESMRAVIFDTRDHALDGSTGAPVFDEKDVAGDSTLEFADLEGGTKHVVARSRSEFVDAYVVATEGPSDVVEVAAKRVAADVPGTVEGTELAQIADAYVYALLAPAAAEGRMRSVVETGSWDEIGERESLRAAEGMHLRILYRASPPTRGASWYRLATPAGAKRDVSVAFSFGRTMRGSDVDLSLPPGVPFEWSAWAEGMQPVFGDQDSFPANERSTARDPCVARLEFRPGSGAVFLLRVGSPDVVRETESDRIERRSAFAVEKGGWSGRRRETSDARRHQEVLAAPAVPGVAFVAGEPSTGVEIGRSDARGEFRLVSTEPIPALTLVARGWRATAMEQLPGDAPRYVVWLRRNP